jgi:pyruvate-formate lyase-activating enzyme
VSRLTAPRYSPCDGGLLSKRTLSIGFVLPFGELSESFFPDTLLAQFCAQARAAGHRGEVVRVYYDGRDPEADVRIGSRLEQWLGERQVDLVVCERLFDPAPVLRHVRADDSRRAVLITRGDSFDPVEGIDYVVGGNPGVTRTGATRRTPAIAELALAFDRLVEKLAQGADPRDVPGVGRVVDGELVLAAPLERPSERRPFDAVVEAEVIAEGEAPPVTRKTLFGNVGCPYAADPMKTSHFQQVALPSQIPVARLGCSFCALGGDYEKRPDAEVVAGLVEQASFWTQRVTTVQEFVLNDQHSLRYLRSLMLASAHLRPMRWLFAARSDSFVREREKVRAAVEAAAQTGHFLEVYLTGFEAFSDEELLRYNKGVTVAEQLAAIQAMRELSRDYPTAFGYSGARGHSLILWNPWTQPKHLRESVESIRAGGLAELFHEVGRNRLRLYRDLPIYYAAERDGVLTDAWEVGDEGAARRKGYNVEHPWRFLDRRTRTAYELALQLRERLGLETELGQLAAIADYVERADSLTAVAEGVDALEAALQALNGQRAAGAPPSGRGQRAAVVQFAGGCNNGCASCSNRDRWLDDAPEALRERIDRARKDAGPILFAGREPTIHPQILELLSEASGADRRPVGVVTNGRRFSSPAFAKQAVAAGLRAAGVKLFGADAKTADAISRDPGGFTQALAGMRNLRAAGVRAVEVRVPLHARNMQQIERYPELVRANGGAQLRVEVALDAIGLDRLHEAAEAVSRIATACARADLPLEASPLRIGLRLFDWMPAS